MQTLTGCCALPCVKSIPKYSGQDDFLSTLDRRFVLDLFSERKAATAWDPVEGESHLDTLLRAIVISRLGRAGDQVGPS